MSGQGRVMTEKQLLAKYEAEKVALTEKSAAMAARLRALEDVIASLRVVLGEAPAKRSTGVKATGTQALILDALAGGRRLSLKALAAECRVKASALGYHLTPLLSSGDIDRRGKSRATTYGIP